MRLRILATALCAALLPLTFPSPAHAWWEYIEQLSGPGKFTGFSIDARFLCIVDRGGATTVKVPSALGVVTTSCRIDPDQKERRRAALDLGVKFVWADNDPRFANSQRISLTTLAPSATFRLIKSDRWDFVDYAVGGGVYWFSSTQFPSFNGMFIEPFRLEFHSTSNMRANEWAAFLPRVRVGMLVFPGGFETAAFLAAPGVAPRIARDRVWNVGLFVDLEPLMRRLE